MTNEPPSTPGEAEPWRGAHDEADAAGDDGYFDPRTGLFVMTMGFLIRRGTCCSSGCRHCPYGNGPSGNVPQAQRTDDPGGGQAP